MTTLVHVAHSLSYASAALSSEAFENFFSKKNKKKKKEEERKKFMEEANKGTRANKKQMALPPCANHTFSDALGVLDIPILRLLQRHEVE